MTKGHHTNKRKAIKIMAKTATKEIKLTKEKAPKLTEEASQNVFVRGILGLALLTVFGSIAVMVVVIWTGTDNMFLKGLTLPAAIFDLVIAFVAFTKILK